jgi:hypothetical protein
MDGVARIAAGIAAVCALAFGLVYLVIGVKDQAGTVRANETRAPEFRVAGGGSVLDIDRVFLSASLAYVSGHETFTVVPGPAVRASTPNTVRFITTYLRGRLLPARLAAPGSARWLLCYGCDPKDWPGYRPVWQSPPYAVERRVS